jgi:hypothetical protein
MANMAYNMKRLGAKWPRGCATLSTSPAKIATHALATPQLSPERALIESSNSPKASAADDGQCRSAP